MTLRTFQQHAVAYGTVPAQVVYQIDGNTVFSGSVTALDQPIPVLPNPELQVDNIAWTWQDDVEFSGTKSISVAVADSPLLLAQSQANYLYGNVEIYGVFYSVEVDGVIYSDPLTDEAINGVPLTHPYVPTAAGQWWYIIPAGGVLTATMHVTAPPAPPG